MRSKLIAATICMAIAFASPASALADETKAEPSTTGPSTEETSAVQFSSETPEQGQGANVFLVSPQPSGKNETSPAVPSTSATLKDGATRQEVTWKRLFGNTAYDTMRAIVGAGWKTSNTVVIATYNGYWDALSASSIAGKYKAPILFTDPGELNAKTSAEIKRLKAKQAVIVGGTSAVSKDVESALAKLGLTVTRYWGKTEQDTAIAIAKQSSNKTTCIISTCIGYCDALSASPYAYRTGAPIFLTEYNKTLSNKTLNAIRSGGYKKVIITGSNGAVLESVERQLKSTKVTSIIRRGGLTAHHTAILLAKYFVSQGMSWTGVGVATSKGYWDALAGSAFCGKNNSVLVLADDNVNPAKDYFGDLKKTMKRAYVFGGNKAVGDKALGELKSATTSVYHATKYTTQYVVDKAAWTETVKHPAQTVQLVPAIFSADKNKVVAVFSEESTPPSAVRISSADRVCWGFDPVEVQRVYNEQRYNKSSSLFGKNPYVIKWVEKSKYQTLISKNAKWCNLYVCDYSPTLLSLIDTLEFNEASTRGPAPGIYLMSIIRTEFCSKHVHKDWRSMTNGHVLGTQKSDFKTKTKAAWTETVKHPEQGHTEKVATSGYWV